MKICPNCKKEYDNEFKFCTQCGTVLEDEQADDITEFIPEEKSAAKEKKAEQPRREKKFCTKCGAQLNPGARFCTRCGQVAEENEPPVQQNGVDPYIVRTEEGIENVKKNKHKIVGIVCIAAAAAVVATAGLGVNSMINGYKQPIRQLEKFVNKPNLKNLTKMIPDVLIDVAKDNGASTIGLELLTNSSMLNDYVEDYFVEGLEENFGKNYKFTIEIENKKKVDTDDVKDDYEELFGKDATDDLKISKAYDLDVTLKIDSDEVDEEDSEEETEIRVVKMKGHWTLDWTTFDF